MGWTNEQVEELKRLWGEGLTTGEIGKTLGVSKNAVVGKAHRLGLQGRPSPIRRPEDEIPAAAEAEVVPPAPEKTSRRPSKSAKKTATAKEKRFTVNDLVSTSCRWPIGDPKDEDFHFCGKEAMPGKPYCLDHCAVAYVSAKNLH